MQRLPRKRQTPQNCRFAAFLRGLYWRGRRGSNPQPPDRQSGAHAENCVFHFGDCRVLSASMSQMDEVDDPGEGGIRHQNRHQPDRGSGGKRGPGRPRNPPENCRYVGWTKRHGHRYQACPRVGGKRVYGRNASREEAQVEAANILHRAKVSAGKAFITFQDACQQIIDIAPSAGTKRDYDECCTTLCGFFGADLPLPEITKDRIRAFIDHRRAARWRDRPISDLRIKKELRVLGRVINVAIQRDQFTELSPLLKVEPPKVKSKEAGHYTIDELNEVVGLIRQQKWPTAERSWRIVAALLFSGLRREEFCRLRVEQIDLQAAVLRDIDGKTNIAALPITKPLAAVLRPLIEGGAGSNFLVPSGTARGPRKPGNQQRSDLERRVGLLNGLFRRFRKALPDRLQSRFHAHTLRHSLRTVLADAGVAQHVKDVLTRHSTRTVGGSYEHVSPLLLRREAERVLDPLLFIVEPQEPGAARANA
ncbi:MAG: tyrosine-type recombinase/integrase [Planctomycetes bacterium]|nr:tyrosine-type recombinase/integrase [Planctomycetota bacterium]